MMKGAVANAVAENDVGPANEPGESATATAVLVHRLSGDQLLERGRRTVVDALLHGKALRIEGGEVVADGFPRRRRCESCDKPGSDKGRLAD
jgi:hypothetical protein